MLFRGCVTPCCLALLDSPCMTTCDVLYIDLKSALFKARGSLRIFYLKYALKAIQCLLFYISVKGINLGKDTSLFFCKGSVFLRHAHKIVEFLGSVGDWLKFLGFVWNEADFRFPEKGREVRQTEDWD